MLKGKIKKTVAFLLAGLMAASCLSACTTEQPATPPQSQVQQGDESQTGEGASSDVEISTENESGLTIDQILDSTVKQPSEYTKKANAEVAGKIGIKSNSEQEYANKGFIAGPDILEIKDDKGNTIWKYKNEYEAGESTTEENLPETANPILWNNYTLNSKIGLFQVNDNIYQVRGYDVTNMTIVEGTSTRIIIDPLLSVECTREALKLVNDNLGEKPISAIMISSTNIDHFGGIKGAIDSKNVADKKLTVAKQLKSGKTMIIAPKDFSKYCVSESIYASHIKGRIRNYMMGSLVKSVGVTGSLGIGIGLGMSYGTISYIEPTYEVQETGEKMSIDGINFEFQLTTDSLATAEMNIYIKKNRTKQEEEENNAETGILFLSDNASGCLGELYGTNDVQIRDGVSVAKYLLEAYALFGDRSVAVIQSHNWPHSDPGNYLLNTASMYKFINDQTLLYLNQGYTEGEIKEKFTLPGDFEQTWYLRQCYVSLDTLISSICQKYIGTNKSNPVYLHELSPSEYARKVVEYMGTTDTIVAKATKDFENGEYQWVAEIMAVVIENNPSHIQAKYLCADALEQLAYQAESGTERNAYLSAVYELRNGTATSNAISTMTGADTLLSMSTEMLLNYMSMLIDANEAFGFNDSFNLFITDTGEEYSVYMLNGVIMYAEGTKDFAANTVKCKKAGLISILQNNEDAIKENVEVEGDEKLIENITKHMVRLPSTFNVIEP
ncbi:MAG: alkyl/aryl-sulfatase [Acutalibacteraceae bacterium]